MPASSDPAHRARPRLLARLFLLLVAVFLPTAATSALWMERRRVAALDASLVDFARARMEAGGREQAEAGPHLFQEPPARLWRPAGPGLPPPGTFERLLVDEYHSRPAQDPPLALVRERPMLWAYSAKGASSNPDAPRLRADALELCSSGAGTHAWRESYLGIPWRCVLVRMPWSEGPAAFVQVRRADERAFGPFGGVETLGTALFLGVVLVLAAVLAAGPLVRRVRRLQVAMQAAESPGEAASVAGLVGAAPRGRGDELDELAWTFDAVSTRVREQMREAARRETALRRFVEDATHDTGLPLTVLQMQLAALEEQVRLGRPADPERVRAALEEVHYLAALVQNLGASAALDAGVGRAVRTTIDLGALVEKVAQRQRLVASVRGGRIECGVPEDRLDVEGDPTAWEQALNNLVHNAVRHGEDGVQVAIVLEEDGAERFRLRVLDDGPGVAEAELQRLSQRSWRGDAARARHPDGRGLGLAIVRDMADQHGLELRFERLLPRGLSVELSGPRTGIARHSA
ncbi:MAG: hypothetical protein RL112_2861 [Planctomycetota bacterium]